MAFAEQSLSAFLPQCDLGSTFAFHSQNEAIPQIVAQLRRQHILIRALSREEQMNPCCARLDAQALYRGRHGILVSVRQHPVGELIVNEEYCRQSVSTR